jgi:acetyltransferase-like isoleucine patch superfamily enzyme
VTRLRALRPAWRDVLFALVFVAPPGLKPFLLRRFGRAEIGRGARIGWLASVVGERVVLGAHSRIAACTLVRCGGTVALGDHAEVSSFTLVYGMGSVRLGRHAYVGPQCLVNADDDVRLGDMSAIGPRSVVFTHGSFLPATQGYPARIAGVSIGDRTWLAAGVFVHPGVSIGDDVFVNSRAVVTGDVAPGSVAEGVPARVVSSIDRLRRRMTPARVDETVRRMIERFVEADLRRALGVAVETGEGIVRFRWAGRPYAIVCAPAVPPAMPGTRVILVGRAPAAGSSPDLVTVDVTAMRTPVPRDPVHARLVGFLLRYYGMHLDWVEASGAAAPAAEPVAPLAPAARRNGD